MGGVEIAEGVRIAPSPMDQSTTKFDLEFEVKEEGEAVTLHVHYAKDLFGPKTVRRMIGRLERLLEGIVTEPEKLISELAGLTIEEERLLTTEWTCTEQKFPEEKSLVDLFDEQVARTPEAVALV